MKRIFALAVIACLLLCGCVAAEPASTQETTEPAQTQSVPETTAAPTTAETTQAATEPAQPEIVTVYLLEREATFDSGYTEYKYDEDHNIVGFTVYTMENDIRFEGFFEERDANGMAGKYRAQWPEGGGDVQLLTWSADGKLEEDMYAGGDIYTHYTYDEKGKLLEKREYYEATLYSAVFYGYDGETLSSVHVEDGEGNKTFQCRVENGRIVEKNCLDPENPYSYQYIYDENGNLTETKFCMDGEVMPETQYQYRQVQVPASRAQYLLEQQKYLLNII